MRSIAETNGKGLGVPVRSISETAAFAHCNFLGGFIAIDNPATSAITRETAELAPAGAGTAEGHGGELFRVKMPRRLPLTLRTTRSALTSELRIIHIMGNKVAIVYLT